MGELKNKYNIRGSSFQSIRFSEAVEEQINFQDDQLLIIKYLNSVKKTAMFKG